MKARSLAALLAPLLAAALAPPARAESPRSGSFDIQLGGYRPNIDAEFVGKPVQPYQAIFGSKRGNEWRALLSKSLYVGWGTLDLGLGAGWFEVTAKGFQSGTTIRSGDDTSLQVAPLTLALTYRFDRFVDLVPLAPYVRFGVERRLWWVTNGAGSTATLLSGGGSGSGATDGWRAAFGLCFLLNSIDPTMARELDRDMGINHTYVFVEASRSKVNDFGSRTSWDLSDEKAVAWSGGLLFVF